MLFMMALSVSSNFNWFWRGSMFKVFFQRRGPGGKNENEAILSRAFCSLRRRATKGWLEKKIPRTGQRTGLAFSLNGTFDDFFNYYFFYGCCLLRDNVYLRR